MAMSRKDYALIASVLSTYQGIGTSDQQSTVDALTRHLANRIGQENSNFDARRFLDAAGLTEE